MLKGYGKICIQQSVSYFQRKSLIKIVIDVIRVLVILKDFGRSIANLDVALSVYLFKH